MLLNVGSIRASIAIYAHEWQHTGIVSNVLARGMLALNSDSSDPGDGACVGMEQVKRSLLTSGNILVGAVRYAVEFFIGGRKHYSVIPRR